MTEVPWDNTTQTPQHNPLEKLPVLFDTEDLDNAVYESHFILDWIEYVSSARLLGFDTREQRE